MSTATELASSREGWVAPEVKLNEAVWNAWVAKGRAQEKRSRAVFMKALKWFFIVGLIAAAALWFYFGDL
jgi:hypothetical protein